MLKFSDLSVLKLTPDDIVIIVGPNNSGKSATLRAIRDRVYRQDPPASPVVKNLLLKCEGSASDALDRIKTMFIRRRDSGEENPLYTGFGAHVYATHAELLWKESPTTLDVMGRSFLHFLTAEERLTMADPPNAISLLREPPSHPIHLIQRDDSLEQRISDSFRAAFGVDLILHRGAGKKVPFHVGERPQLQKGEDRVSRSYVERVEALPELEFQGDGMRSFAGILLATTVGNESILLIDEPEAFLHPPQARRLGTVLATEGRTGRQVFVATHSGDVLRGALDSNSKNIRVVRIRREHSTNIVREINKTELARVWGDPLLRYSNILDGVFHDRVIVCEGDSDARFYAAVSDALADRGGGRSRQLDVMFTHCGGKARLAVVVRALRQLEVPVLAIPDFDILADEPTLAGLVEAAGGVWTDLSARWRLLKAAIEGKKSELGTKEVRTEIGKVLDAVNSDVFPSSAVESIASIMRRSSPWSYAKASGRAVVPSGDATKACDSLLVDLEAIGIVVVPVGQLEGFARSVSGHGTAWVSEAIKKDLVNDRELRDAREFVTKLATVR